MTKHKPQAALWRFVMRSRYHKALWQNHKKPVLLRCTVLGATSAKTCPAVNLSRVPMKKKRGGSGTDLPISAPADMCVEVVSSHMQTCRSTRMCAGMSVGMRAAWRIAPGPFFGVELVLEPRTGEIAEAFGLLCDHLPSWRPSSCCMMSVGQSCMIMYCTMKIMHWSL